MNRMRIPDMIRAAVLLLAAVQIFLRCSGNDTVAGGASETGNSGLGKIRIETFDAPPTDSVDHLYLAITAFEAHHRDSGWLRLSYDSLILDFIELINGKTALIVDTTLPAGQYDQMRLRLGESPSVIVAGLSYGLLIPSGLQTGIKLDGVFTVDSGKTLALYMDFDIGKSLTLDANGYRLAPSFTIFEQSRAGKICGTAIDNKNKPVYGALVSAQSSADTTSTITGRDGRYLLILKNGTYGITCATAHSAVSDTVYADISVNPGDSVCGYDFIADK